MTFEWVRDELRDAGKTQRDLAQAWAVSEGAVSRWMAGTERKDLPLSRAVALSSMLGMSLDELARRLGAMGPKAQTDALSQQVARSKEIPIGSHMNMSPGTGKARVFLHLDIPVDVAVQVMTMVDKALKTDA